VSPPAGFTVEGKRGYYRPQGEVTLDEAIALLVAATEYACTLGLSELVLNASGFTGYELPDILDRYQYSATLAHIGAGTLRVAQVMPADVIDPRRFGVLVANNRDLETRAFTNEADAVAWLDEPR
jgi:hypothetical protein